MNDFLQSIRGNQKEKRVPKTRRNFDNSNFNASPNFQNQGNYQSIRAGNIKRPITRAVPHLHVPGDEPQQSYPPQPEQIDIMLELIDIYTKHQQMMITVHEKRILAEERKAIALEEIAEYLRVITMPSFQQQFSFKNTTDTSKEPISSDSIEKPDSYIDADQENITHSSEALESDEMRNEDEVFTAQVVENQPIDGEIVDEDDEYIDNKTADAEYVETTNIGSKQDYSQDVEYSMKPSVQEFEDKDNKDAVRVIRRKRTDNISSPADESEAVSLDSGQKAESFEQKQNLSAQLKDSSEQTREKALLSREEIIEIINSMRAKGKTFDEVAQHLINLGQPTFSGRGVWHAQTIHRICTRNEKKAAQLFRRKG
ncbi:MAG: hypothetical protein HQK73_02110 [Desulfamplus sp.]|nr:hypothetical protein [Desulfamplus sp.]MBF0411717.1 hypothetical protein [Desulfamplus sp.]